MAAGDLITRNGQYEFQSILFNNGPWANPSRYMRSIRGLFGISMKVSDVERQGDHGSFLGDDYLTAKTLELSFDIDCATGTLAEQEALALTGAFQPQTAELPFVFAKAGMGGTGSKKVLYVRPRDVEVPTSYDMGRGFIRGSGRLYVPDPRIYTLAQTTVAGQINNGTSTNGIVTTGLGSIYTGAIVTITGPTVNPRVANSADSNKTLRLDVTLTTGQVLAIDTFRKTVTIDGADAYQYVRTDNQWPQVRVGANSWTYSRTGTTGNSPWSVKFQDAWT